MKKKKKMESPTIYMCERDEHIHEYTWIYIEREIEREIRDAYIYTWWEKEKEFDCLFFFFFLICFQYKIIQNKINIKKKLLCQFFFFSPIHFSSVLQPREKSLRLHQSRAVTSLLQGTKNWPPFLSHLYFANSTLAYNADRINLCI